MQVQIEESWYNELSGEFEKEYFKTLTAFLKKEKREGKIIYPEGKNIFNAFTQTPFNKVKVVLLGQDPYHGRGQAHGLSFSVQAPTLPPPSLKNIFKELHDDLGLPLPEHGDLTSWAQQGILLLNASLTVIENKPMSHSKIGWNIFTDQVIATISAKKEQIIFLLWGKFAQEKETLIHSEKHYILKAPHPSPFSAHQGFFGCRHFSKVNSYLASKNKTPINWVL